MIEYYEQLMNEEQQELTRIIKLLFRQTFLLEHKYEKRSGRFVPSQDFRIADRHLEFLKAYFAVAGIQVCENSHMGLIYLQGETIVGEKLPRLASIYVLVLKLIYDEQMAAASSSVQVHTTLGEVNGRAGEFGLLKTTPSPTELRRTVTLLKRYQIVEPLDGGGEPPGHLSQYPGRAAGRRYPGAAETVQWQYRRQRGNGGQQRSRRRSGGR